MDPASPWQAWAVDQLQSCSERAPLRVNLVIYTELLVPGPAVDALDALLDVYFNPAQCVAMDLRRVGRRGVWAIPARWRAAPHPFA